MKISPISFTLPGRIGGLVGIASFAFTFLFMPSCGDQPVQQQQLPPPDCSFRFFDFEDSERQSLSFSLANSDGRSVQAAPGIGSKSVGNLAAFFYAVHAHQRVLQGHFDIDAEDVRLLTADGDFCALQEAGENLHTVQSLSQIIRTSLGARDPFATGALMQHIGEFETTRNPDGFQFVDEAQQGYESAANFLGARYSELAGQSFLGLSDPPGCADAAPTNLNLADVQRFLNELATNDLGQPGLWNAVRRSMPSERDQLVRHIRFAARDMGIEDDVVTDFTRVLVDRFVYDSFVDDRGQRVNCVLGVIGLPTGAPNEVQEYLYVIHKLVPDEGQEDGEQDAKFLRFQLIDHLICSGLYEFYLRAQAAG